MSVSAQLPNVVLSRTLTLDSTSFMSGNLIDRHDIALRFSLQTSVNNDDGVGPITRISSFIPRRHNPAGPAEESEVGAVQWRSSAIGRSKTIVKMPGSKELTLGALMKCNSMGSKRFFGGLGEGQDIKWIETDGTWQCMPAHEKRILAILHSRIATRGTRIEISTEGAPQIDTIVLTALLVLHGEGDWKAFQKRRPVSASPYSTAQPRSLVNAPTPHVTALTLTLSTNSFIEGLLSVGGQLMYGMRTTGNRTSVTKYTWEDRPRLEEFASIEWLDSTFFGTPKSIVTYKDQKRCLEDFLFPHFPGSRLRRFGQPDFIPWLQWVENLPSWACYSHPNRVPLAILDRRFTTAGSRLDVTFDGLEHLDAIVLSTILVIHSPHDWRRTNLEAMHLRSGIPAPNLTIRRGLSRSVSNLPNASPENASPTIEDVDGVESPPGLPRRASESWISRISADSEIPMYSPPPLGLFLDYAEVGYASGSPGGRMMMNPSVSAAASMINLGHMAQTGGLASSSLAANARLATPPPSYYPPTYSESVHW